VSLICRGARWSRVVALRKQSELAGTPSFTFSVAEVLVAGVSVLSCRLIIDAGRKVGRMLGKGTASMIGVSVKWLDEGEAIRRRKDC